MPNFSSAMIAKLFALRQDDHHAVFVVHRELRCDEICLRKELRVLQNLSEREKLHLTSILIFAFSCFTVGCTVSVSTPS